MAWHFNFVGLTSRRIFFCGEKELVLLIDRVTITGNYIGYFLGEIPQQFLVRAY
jgi:hypothetical protein